MNYKTKTYLIFAACLVWGFCAIVATSACINKLDAFHVVCGIGNLVANLALLGITLSKTSKEYSIKYLNECNPRPNNEEKKEDK